MGRGWDPRQVGGAGTDDTHATGKLTSHIIDWRWALDSLVEIALIRERIVLED